MGFPCGIKKMLRVCAKRERETKTKLGVKHTQNENNERGLKFLGLEERKGFYGCGIFVVTWEEIRPRGLGGMNDKKFRSVPRTMILSKSGVHFKEDRS